MIRHAHLNVFVAGYGYHEAAWHDAPRRAPDLAHFTHLAEVAEAGVLDSLFFADSPGVAEFRPRFMAQSGYDPIDLLAALIPTTTHIGLLATASTTYSAPWDLARRFATLDHLSGGRAGWNIVTTSSPYAAPNFASVDHLAHADRYERAREFVEVVLKVWDGWEDDAVVASAETGIWADSTRLHPPHHRGAHFSVAGLLPMPRAPQGYPVLAQAGSSADGVDLAGRYADLVFTPQADIEAAITFRATIHDSARRHGRSADDVRTLPGLSFLLAPTHADAEREWQRLEDTSSPEFRLLNLGHVAGIGGDALAAVDPDGPFPYELFAQASGQTFAAAVSKVAREGGLTFRETAQRFSTLPGGLHHVGTPQSLADLITEWHQRGAVDGFTLQPLRLPVDLELFVERVIPILQARGVTPHSYTAGTLRDRLALTRPPNRHTTA
ncbi:MAG TPA: NtaA/DmoA family FMN-dependent monooxygenase [Ilumatobacteraceae bacterium]